MLQSKELNALGSPLEPCSLDPITGFFRTGACESGKNEQSIHTVCIYANEEFLEYSKSVGNDLSTPMPQYNFEGVKAGGSWCLNAMSFLKAIQDKVDIKIFIHSTNITILELIDLETLKKYAIDL